MKVISLWNPWAALVCLGIKKFETRSWVIKHRGPMLIHAAKRWDKPQRQLVETLERHLSAKEHQKLSANCENRGAIIGMVEVVACLRTEVVRDRIDLKEALTGDFSNYRYAWALKNPILFDNPIEEIGKQRFWTYDKEIPDLKNISYATDLLGGSFPVRIISREEYIATFDKSKEKK